MGTINIAVSQDPNCGCTISRGGPAADIKPCDFHVHALALSGSAAVMPLSALRSVDRSTSDEPKRFILVDRYMHLTGVAAKDSTAEFLPYVLAALAPYANREVPDVIEMGAGCQLHIVRLAEPVDSTVMIVFVSTSDKSSGLRRAVTAFGLTPRESTVLSLLADTLPNEQIAKTMGIALSTVSDHMHNLSHKMGCTRRSQMVRKLFGY